MIASNTDPRWFVFMFLPVDELKRLATRAGWDVACSALQACNTAAEFLQIVLDNATALLPPGLSPAVLSGFVALVHRDVADEAASAAAAAAADAAAAIPPVYPDFAGRTAEGQRDWWSLRCSERNRMIGCGASILSAPPSIAGQPTVCYLGCTAGDGDTFGGVADRFGLSREALHGINLGFVPDLPRLSARTLDGHKLAAGTRVALEPDFPSKALVDAIAAGRADPCLRDEPRVWWSPAQPVVAQAPQPGAQAAGPLGSPQGLLIPPPLGPPPGLAPSLAVGGQPAVPPGGQPADIATYAELLRASAVQCERLQQQLAAAQAAASRPPAVPSLPLVPGSVGVPAPVGGFGPIGGFGPGAFGGGAPAGPPSSSCFLPVGVSGPNLAELEAQNAALLKTVRELTGSVNDSFVGESGASFDPLNPASLSNPLAQSLACRILTLERDNLRSDFTTIKTVNEYFMRASERVLTNPSIPDAAARAIANLNRERAKHAERVGAMAEWGGGSEESFVRELMFKHTLGAKDPSMKAVEEIGMRLFKEQRKRKIAPPLLLSPTPSTMLPGCCASLAAMAAAAVALAALAPSPSRSATATGARRNAT